ncbi:hypothetical protein CMI41_01445, partial [Candidatus Pacearchaeota archaeon]|nr:hypothetical protein [Candidatus Pacearchaeota archaeon]
ERNQCIGGEFNLDLYCTDESLDAVCEETSETVCSENGDVHYIDSCENLEEMVDDCDYDSGTICEEDIEGAYCKSLNCEDALNGEEWCVGPGGSIGGDSGTYAFDEDWVLEISANCDVEDFGNAFYGGDVGEYTLQFFNYHGTPAFRLAHGDIFFTKAYVGSINNPGGSSDHWAELAGVSMSGTHDIRIEYYYSLSEVKIYWDEALVGHFAFEISNMPGDVSISIGSGGAAVGSRYFRQYCLDGEVYTEGCGDYRTETCESANCVNNPWQDCFAANNAEADPITGSFVDEEMCDSDYCEIWSPESSPCAFDKDYGRTYCMIGDTLMYSSDLYGGWKESATYESLEELDGDRFDEVNSPLQDLNLEMCVPLVPGGLQFWSIEDSVCSYGNYEATLYMDHDKGTCNKWTIVGENYDGLETGPGFWGNAGLINLNITNWKQACDDGWAPTKDNPLDAALFSGHDADDVSDSDINRLVLDEEIPDPALIEILEARCQAISDCSGKANFVGASGPSWNGYSFHCEDEDGRNDQISCSFSFECVPYNAPSGGSSCSVCGEDGLTCSEYRCKALGDCEYNEPVGADKGYCYDEDDYDSPVISVEVVANDTIIINEEIPYNTPIELTITTDEASFCKFDVGESSNSFDDMNYYVGEEFEWEHKLRLMYSGQESYDDEFYEQSVLGESGELEIYIRCEDVAENAPVSAKLIVLTIAEPPDKLAPQIDEDSFIPANDGYVAMNLTTVEASFYLLEDAECRWSDEDEDYSLMTNDFLCFSQECSGVLNVSLETNKFYIRCNDTSGNVNTASEVYTIKKAQTELAIESISPNDEDTTDDHLVFDLEVVVDGGAGDEICEYMIEGQHEEYIEFLESSGDTHTQEFDLAIGEYTVKIYCYDSAGDSDLETQTLRINQDLNSPSITRAYAQGSSLVIRTKEEAECRYYSYSCSEDWDDMTSFSGSDKRYTVTAYEGRKYYIKCMDELGNIPGDGVCTKIVRL